MLVIGLVLKQWCAGSFSSSSSHVLQILYLNILLMFQVCFVGGNLVTFTMCCFFFSQLGFNKKISSVCFILYIMIAMELGDIWGWGGKNDMRSYAQNHAVEVVRNAALSDPERAVVSWVTGRRFFFITCANRKVIWQLKPETTVNTQKKTETFQRKIAS